MTRSIRGYRRAAVLLAGAAATTLLLSACGAGQIAETAIKASSIPGVNADLRAAGGIYKVRNLLIAYEGTKPYPAGGNAPLSVAIFNDTNEEVTVKVTSESARSVVLASAAPSPTPPAATPTPSAPATASATASGTAQPSRGATESQVPLPTGSPEPVPSASVMPGSPASIRIPARGFVVLSPTSGNFLRLEGLNSELRAGQTVNLVFDFNGKQLATTATVMVPLSPAPVAPPVSEPRGHGG